MDIYSSIPIPIPVVFNKLNSNSNSALFASILTPIPIPVKIDPNPVPYWPNGVPKLTTLSNFNAFLNVLKLSLAKDVKKITASSTGNANKCMFFMKI